jgi:hypothetical protein
VALLSQRVPNTMSYVIIKLKPRKQPWVVTSHSNSQTQTNIIETIYFSLSKNIQKFDYVPHGPYQTYYHAHKKRFHMIGTFLVQKLI